MPIYEYRCDECGDVVEVFRHISDEPVTVCEQCGGGVRRVFHPVAIHFKGSGFYTTDYGRSPSSRPAPDGESQGPDSDVQKQAGDGKKDAKPAAAGAEAGGGNGSTKKAAG